MAIRNGNNDGNTVVFKAEVDSEKVAAGVAKGLSESMGMVDKAVTGIVNAINDGLKKGLNFGEYYQDAEELAKKVREAANSFRLDPDDINAEELIRAFNAVKAASDDAAMALRRDITDFETLFATAKELNAQAAQIYSVDAMRGVQSIMSQLQNEYNKYQQIIEDGRQEREYLRQELERTQSENRTSVFNDLVDRAKNEFRAFLTANNISTTDFNATGRFKELFNAIESGAMTSSQAIAKFKKDFAGLLPQDATTGIDAFMTRLNELFALVESGIHSGAGSGQTSILGENLVGGADAIAQEGEAIRTVTEQKPGVDALTASIVALIQAEQAAGGDTEGFVDDIKSVVESLHGLSEIDTAKLQSMGSIFTGLASINGFKVDRRNLQNLVDFTDRIQALGDISNIKQLSGLSLKWATDLKLQKATVDNFERLVTQLTYLSSSVNVDDILKLSNADYSGFEQIRVPDVSETALNSMQKMSESLNAVKNAAATLRAELDLTGKAVTQSSQKMANAGISHTQIEGILKSGLKGNNADTAGMALQHAGLRKDDADRVISILRGMSAPIEDVKTSWQKSEDAASDYLTVTLKASEAGKEVQKSLTFKPVEEEIDGVTQSYLKMIERGQEHLNLKKQEAAETKAAQKEAAEIKAQTDATWALYDAEKAEAKIYEDARRQREEEDRLAEAGWRSDAAEMEAAEEEALNRELERAKESVAREREALAAEMGDARSERAEQLRKIQEESLKAAEKTRIEEERQAAAQEEANRKAEESAAKRAVAADQEAEKAQKAADEYEAAEKRKQAASEMTAEQAEAELTRLQSLQLDYKAQIDKAEGAGYESDTVESLRRNFDEIAKEIPILESVRDGTNKTAKSTDEYKKKVTALKDQLVLLKKELTSQMSSGGAFTTLEGKQASIATQTIAAKKSELERYIGSVTEQGYGSSEEVNKLQNLIPLYDNLNERIREGTITQKDYTDSLKLLNIQSDEAVRALNARISAQKDEDAEKEKAYRQEMQNLNVQKQANEYIGKASKMLREYAAAEHSKNESSREAYAEIKRYKGLLEDLYNSRNSMDPQEFARREREYTNEIEKNSRVIEANGDAHMTAFGKIGKAIKTHLTTLTATASIGSVMRYIRQMIDAVKEIDSAMTELKKVTDETDARYEKFLTDAATRAKNLSATISDTVNATANFARLGLSLEDAEMAADAAIVYKSVGDGINSIDDAAESIISTMKAFGIEANDAMSIVDKFNEVGKQLCPAA